MADRNSYPDYHHLVVDWRSSLITVPMGAVTVGGSGKAPLVRAGARNQTIRARLF
jgi:tetraacyldisaccharide-1-P 4'-kinase